MAQIDTDSEDLTFRDAAVLVRYYAYCIRVLHDVAGLELHEADRLVRPAFQFQCAPECLLTLHDNPESIAARFLLRVRKGHGAAPPARADHAIEGALRRSLPFEGDAWSREDVAAVREVVGLRSS